ncbi:hypothetical protein [Chryseobacterium oranimense]|uniref:hypothetical protein n=1 Tax=Chryseobacterium oranimense TaxID=421058 RepID=UPI0031D879DD
MKKVYFTGAVLYSVFAFSQIGIHTDKPKATLDVVATPKNLTKIDGIIAPRLDKTELKAKDSLYTTEQKGVIVYITSATGSSSSKTVNVTVPGYYYFDGVIWQAFNAKEPWNVQGTTNQATLNTDNIYQIGSVAIGRNSALAGVQLDVDGSIRGGGADRTAIIGENSLAIGINTIASAANSIALGNTTKAEANNSTALGWNTVASGLRSSAFGQGTSASGENSTAFGLNTTASGARSTAFGNATTASGANAFALGWNTLARGDRAFSAGQDNDAIGNNSVAIGMSAVARGNRSISVGTGTIAREDDSFAMGTRSEARGVRSMSFGYEAIANGMNSTSLGWSTKSNGDRSLATGYFTTASGESSAAFGSESIAAGDRSIAMGNNTIAPFNNEMVIGQWNYAVNNGGDASSATGTVFQIGNGSGTSNRSNALTVRRNGWIGIGYAQPSTAGDEILRINGKVRMSGELYVPAGVTPDYVFEKHFEGTSGLKPDYQMMSLQEVEEFVRVNKHLPGVPSAREIKEQGSFSLTKATEINLEKIEELYLHIIELKKEVLELKKQLEGNL